MAGPCRRSRYRAGIPCRAAHVLRRVSSVVRAATAAQWRRVQDLPSGRGGLWEFNAALGHSATAKFRAQILVPNSLAEFTSGPRARTRLIEPATDWVVTSHVSAVSPSSRTVYYGKQVVMAPRRDLGVAAVGRGLLGGIVAIGLCRRSRDLGRRLSLYHNNQYVAMAHPHISRCNILVIMSGMWRRDRRSRSSPWSVS